MTRPSFHDIEGAERRYDEARRSIGAAFTRPRVDGAAQVPHLMTKAQADAVTDGLERAWQEFAAVASPLRRKAYFRLQRWAKRRGAA